jgi:RimJ/RimL family protein N-acetyltransferase
VTEAFRTAPILETERLKLRGQRLDDFGACAAMWADPIVTRYIGGHPQTEEESWARFLRYVGHWASLGFGYWVIEDKATGRFVGEIGFADYKRNIEPSISGKPEIGWVLIPAAHGRGYATEAARAVVSWGDAHFGPIHTTCLITPENVASIRIAEKCGYRESHRTTYKGESVIVFVR